MARQPHDTVAAHQHTGARLFRAGRFRIDEDVADELGAAQSDGPHAIARLPGPEQQGT